MDDLRMGNFIVGCVSTRRVFFWGFDRLVFRDYADLAISQQAGIPVVPLNIVANTPWGDAILTSPLSGKGSMGPSQ
jgi:hypothetical protein